MKTLKFGFGLLAPVLCEDKAITLRKYRPEAHTFSDSELFRGEFADHPDLNVILQASGDTVVVRAGDLDDRDAQDDGFKDAAHAMEVMQHYYPEGFSTDDQMAIIRFNLVEIAER